MWPAIRGNLEERLRTIGRFTAFGWEVFRHLPGVYRRPYDVLDECYRVGVGSFPLVAAAALSIGVVSWMQARLMLVAFGSEALLPAFVAVFVVIGLAPTLTGLVVAGQVGARLGAELGSMRITEQVDALEAMGFSSVAHLAATRVFACVTMLPLLTVMMDAVALGAAFGAESIGGSLALSQFVQESMRFLKLGTVLMATSSSVLFGFLIGVLGCWFGLTAGHGTEGVGRASTRGVIGSMLAVLLANVLWVRVMQIVLS